MAVQLPPGWTITESIEEVPSPNAGIFTSGNFARRTFTCRDQHGQYVCASGAEEDCESQAQTAAQARVQQQPYYEAT